MAHVYLLNQIPYSYNHTFSAVWSVTRAMKKAGWKYLASSTGVSGGVDASTTPNPLNDKWGSGTTPAGQTGSVASITTKTLDDLVITGLTGMGLNSIGDFLTFTGAATSANNGTFQITELISATSVKIRNPAGVAADANNGAIVWTERDPTLDSYPAIFDFQAAWIVMQGPTTIKVPISAAPSGTFIRGEKITQATTNAEGELLGVVWTTASNSFLVIMPRVGTFNSTNIITGAVSQATVTPTGTLSTYVEEVMIAKFTDIYGGWIFSQRVDASTEATQRFSYLATQGYATFGVAPGNGTGTNALPTIAYTAKGSVGGGSNWAYWQQTILSSGSTNMGASARVQVVAANCIGTPGVSPDGTFWWSQALPGATTPVTHNLNGHFRVDDTEVGDVDPFVWLSNNDGSATRTTGQTSSSYPTFDANGPFWSPSGGTALCGWRRRGYGTNDAYLGRFYYGYLATNFNSYSTLVSNLTDPERVACHTDSLFVREPVWMVSLTLGQRMRKGTMRWLSFVGSGSGLVLWENKTWLQVSNVLTSYPAVVVGPWDGATDPVFA